jgi:hypothetical protein
VPVASADELVEAICSVIRVSATPIPISLMNHSVEEAASIIGAVVERCAKLDIALATIFIDPELGSELGLADGKILDHGHSPIVRWKGDLGRQVIFQRG